MPESAISVSGLRKVYGDVVAVDDVSLEVTRGEIFGVIGSNGSGKTTSIECLQGLRKADAGTIDVLGLDPRTQANRLRHRVGSQLQESALPERMRVWEALDLFGSLTPTSRDWESLCRDWGLWEKRNSAYATLSGGQRQRLFIALALVTSPELVFLDEMTTGLDPLARRTTWDLIRQVRDGGATVVLVTHFMDEAEVLCDRIALFERGRVVAIDTPAGLVARYAGESTVTFTADQDVGFLEQCPGVERIERIGPKVSVAGTGALLAHVGAALVAQGIAPLDLEVRRGSLEDVFEAFRSPAADE